MSRVSAAPTSLARSRRGTLRHFPALVLVLGEPSPFGLADTVRTGVRAYFGEGAAIGVHDFGSLRLRGVLGFPGTQLQRPALRAWAVDQLLELVTRHSGEYPTSGPILSIVLVGDAENPDARRLLLRMPEILRSAVDSVNLPPGLQARIVALVGWPSCWEPVDRPRLAAWSRDVADLVLRQQKLDAVFLTGRSNYRPQARSRLLYLSSDERDALLSAQLQVLLSTAVLHEALAAERGLPRHPWMALGLARAIPAASPLQPVAAFEQTLNGDRQACLRFLRARAWPYLTGSAGGARSLRGSEAVWTLGMPARLLSRPAGPPARRIEGDAIGPTVVRCLYGFPAASVDGLAEWDPAYAALSLDERRRLHRFAPAFQSESPFEIAGAGISEIPEGLTP